MNLFTTLRRLLWVAGIGASAATPPVAGAFTLTFEDLPNGAYLDDFYAGGYNRQGLGPGPDWGVSFAGPARAIVDSDAGGGGNFGGEPSPSTAVVFDGSLTIINVPAGFDGVGFYYSTSSMALMFVTQGLNGTGNNAVPARGLAPTPSYGAPDPTGRFSPFVPFGISWGSLAVAHSVVIYGTPGEFFIDNLFISALGQPPVVPEAGTAGSGLAVVGAAGLAAWVRARRS